MPKVILWNHQSKDLLDLLLVSFQKLDLTAFQAKLLSEQLMQ
jgi:hypothetical protein